MYKSHKSLSVKLFITLPLSPYKLLKLASLKRGPSRTRLQSRLQKNPGASCLRVELQAERLWGLTAMPAGITEGHGSLGGPGFTAQQFTTYTPAPALPRLEFVTCRFIFLSIKTTLQAHRDSWRGRESESGKHIRRGMKRKNKTRETSGTKRSLMAVRESGKVCVNASSP